MADITRVPFLRHLRSTPTRHVVQIRRGAVVRSGTGQSFWFRPLTSSLSEIPVDDRELATVLHARTADFQAVSAQATLGYRLADPEAVAARVDFSIDPDRGAWRGEPLEQLDGLLVDLAQQLALDLLAGLPLERAVGHAGPLLRDHLEARLVDETRLRETGIVITGVRITSVRPEPDLERALQTPARELVQQEADRATYERRALAVERERAISENELQSTIELAGREEALLTQQGANARRRATDEAEAQRIATEGQVARERLQAQARAEAQRALGEADAAAQRASVEAYADADAQILLALALRELARNLPEIGSVTVTPDLVSGALAALGARPGGGGR